MDAAGAQEMAIKEKMRPYTKAVDWQRQGAAIGSITVK